VDQSESGGSPEILLFQARRESRIMLNAPQPPNADLIWAMRETPRADINSLLESLLSRMRHIFQEKLVGLYLYGSLTTGDFDPESSDIDLLAAISSDVSDTEIDALRAMHLDFARDNPGWDDRIDVQYLSVAALRTFRTQRSPIAIISAGEPFHMTEAGKEWLMNWYVVREQGVALFGPPAKALIAPISRDEFAGCIRDYAVEVADRMKGVPDRKGQAYAILTMCRALYVHRIGGQASKRQAALWAQEELPQWAGLIQSAVAWREAWREQQVDHAATRAETIRFVNFVRDQILA
jgi:predicted nucleotidyltransferase